MNKLSSLLLSMVFTLCLTAANLAAAPQLTVYLGMAGNFAVLAGTTVTNTGETHITGDIGLSPGSSVTGFPPGAVTGTIYTPDKECPNGVCVTRSNTVASLAQTFLTVAYNNAAARETPILLAGNLAGETLRPGLYKSTSSLEISGGDLTLSGNGVYIFQIASTLTLTSTSRIVLSGGARAAYIFWQVGSSATLGTYSVFEGTILAHTSITIDTGATLNGRALARTGAVTLQDNAITIP